MRPTESEVQMVIGTGVNDSSIRLLKIFTNLLPQILDLFRGSKIGVPSGCLEKTSSFKIMKTDDVTL